VPAIPVPPDYTKQFEKIIEILGRRQTPQWVWLVIGWLLGIASTVVVGWINGRKDRRNVRRMLYREMARNYWQLSLLRSRLMNLTPEERLINDDPKDVLEFGAFEHAKNRRDVFESLKEIVDIETVYELFHRSEDLSSATQLTVFQLNPVLGAFEGRVGKVFSKRILLAVSSPLIRTSIERIILDRKKDQGEAA
jgi:hypothetical protein